MATVKITDLPTTTTIDTTDYLIIEQSDGTNKIDMETVGNSSVVTEFGTDTGNPAEGDTQSVLWGKALTKFENYDTQIEEVLGAITTQTSTTAFNDDGSITQTMEDGSYITTIFESDGSITQSIYNTSGTLTRTVVTTFNDDGSITETYTSYSS